MKRSVALFPIVLALGAMILAPHGGTQAQDAREGPIEIDKCQTISQPGSYKLVKNLMATGDCLAIAADGVTVDLAGFSISGNGSGTGILEVLPPSPPGMLQGIAVRNGPSQVSIPE